MEQHTLNEYDDAYEEIIKKLKLLLKHKLL